MLGVLVLLILVMPFVELAVIVQAAQSVGIPETLVLLALVSVLGGWLVKREGVGVLRRARDTVDRGEVPARELVDGVLVLLAGALLLSPGFVSDVVAILLLLPPSRAVVRALALRRLRTRIEQGLVDIVAGPSPTAAGGVHGRGGATRTRGRAGVIDVDEVDASPRRAGPPPGRRPIPPEALR